MHINPLTPREKLSPPSHHWIMEVWNEHLFPSPARAGGGVSHHKLVLGVGYAPGQSALRPLEPDGRRLPAGLSAASDLGHLRQGLGASQSPARQPARLFPLVSRAAEPAPGGGHCSGPGSGEAQEEEAWVWTWRHWNISVVFRPFCCALM